jgi:hypothetical protein
MRNAFVTPFWQAAYKSLPASVRGRYLADLQAAERWELGLEALIEAWSRTKQLFSRLAPAH